MTFPMNRSQIWSVFSPYSSPSQGQWFSGEHSLSDLIYQLREGVERGGWIGREGERRGDGEK